MDDPLDLSYLVRDIERAPTSWLHSTIEHLDQIRRADVIVRDEPWKLAVLHDQADRAMDLLLAELGRRIAAEPDAA